MATISLQDALERQYRMSVIADQGGGYVVEFPDLPGCITQIETLDELAASANEARELWIESAFERGMPIPEPTFPEELSGKFNVRLPKKLHRALVDQADAEGVSLNQLVVHLLSCGTSGPESAFARLEEAIRALSAKVDTTHHKLGVISQVQNDWTELLTKTVAPPSTAKAPVITKWSVVRKQSHQDREGAYDESSEPVSDASIAA